MNGAGYSLLQGVNISGHNLIRMEALQEISFSHSRSSRTRQSRDGYRQAPNAGASPRRGLYLAT